MRKPTQLGRILGMALVGALLLALMVGWINALAQDSAARSPGGYDKVPIVTPPGDDAVTSSDTRDSAGEQDWSQEQLLTAQPAPMPLADPALDQEVAPGPTGSPVEEPSQEPPKP